jgi:hypothetical protein
MGTAMKIYVDGNAVLRFLTEGDDPIVTAGDRAQGRKGLAHWLARYCENRDCSAILVYDGTKPGEVLPPTQRVGSVKVVNTPYGLTARSRIAGAANRNASATRTLVVTDDWQLAKSLERGKARVQTPAGFINRARKLMGKDTEALATEPDEKFSGLSDGEVDFWLGYFDGED